MNQQHKKRVIPKGREDTERLDWLIEHLKYQEGVGDLRKYIDNMRATDHHPILTLGSNPNQS